MKVLNKTRLSGAAIMIAALATINCSRHSSHSAQDAKDLQILAATSSLGTEKSTEKSSQFRIDLQSKGEISDLDISKVEYFSCETPSNCEKEAVMTITEDKPNQGKPANDLKGEDESQLSYSIDLNNDEGIDADSFDLDKVKDASNPKKETLMFSMDSHIYNQFGQVLKVVVTSNKGSDTYFYSKDSVKENEITVIQPTTEEIAISNELMQTVWADEQTQFDKIAQDAIDKATLEQEEADEAAKPVEKPAPVVEEKKADAAAPAAGNVAPEVPADRGVPAGVTPVN